MIRNPSAAARCDKRDINLAARNVTGPRPTGELGLLNILLLRLRLIGAILGRGGQKEEKKTK